MGRFSLSQGAHPASQPATRGNTAHCRAWEETYRAMGRAQGMALDLSLHAEERPAWDTPSFLFQIEISGELIELMKVLDSWREGKQGWENAESIMGTGAIQASSSQLCRHIQTLPEAPCSSASAPACSPLLLMSWRTASSPHSQGTSLLLWCTLSSPSPEARGGTCPIPSSPCSLDPSLQKSKTTALA